MITTTAANIITAITIIMKNVRIKHPNSKNMTMQSGMLTQYVVTLRCIAPISPFSVVVISK